MAYVQRLGGVGLTGVCLAWLGCSGAPQARDAGALVDAADRLDLGFDGDVSESRDAIVEDGDATDAGVLADANLSRDGDVPDARMCVGEYRPDPDPIDVTGWASFGGVIEVGEDLVWIHRADDSSYRVVRTTPGLEAIDTSTLVRDVPSEVDGVSLSLGDGLGGPYLASSDDWLLLLNTADGAVYGRVYGTDGAPKSGTAPLWPALAPSTRRVFAATVRGTEFALIAVEINAGGGDCGSRVYLRRVSRLGDPGPITGPVPIAADVANAYPSGERWILAGLDGCREDSLASWFVDAEGRVSLPVALPMLEGARSFLTLLPDGTWAFMDERRLGTGEGEVVLTVLEPGGETVLPPTPIWFSRGRIADFGTVEVGPEGELAWAFSEFIGRGAELETTQQRFVRIIGGSVVQNTILARMDGLNLTPATSFLRWRDGYYVVQWGLAGYYLGALSCDRTAP